MWRRISRILRSEVEHVRRSVADAVRRAAPAERFDSPAGGGRDPAGRADDPRTPGEDVRRAFAALELPLTATADDVRRAYRRLMDRYHPDRHAGDPEREAVANEVARRLTEAYRLALAFRKTQPV